MVEAIKHLKKSFVIVSLLVGLIGLQSVFAQTKFDEYNTLNTDDESTRIDNFIIGLINQPKAKGLFIVYVGDNKSRIGNIQKYIENVKWYLSLRNVDTERISFAVAEGKTSFHRELWLINKGDKLPQFNKENFELKGLQKRLLYATFCNECRPAVLALRNDIVDWDTLAKIIKENSEYEVFVKVGNISRYYDVESEKDINPEKYAKDLKKWFSRKYKIDESRFKYEFYESDLANIDIFIKNKNYDRSKENRCGNKN